MVVRAILAVALLSGVAVAGEQFESPSGQIVWVDDDHLQSALENGYKRVSAEEAARIVTKPADEPKGFDWSLVAIGAAITVGVAGVVYAVQRKR